MSQATQSQAHNHAQTQPRAQAHRSFAEWVTFGIATLILVMIASLVIYDWVGTPPTPPVISLTRSGDIREVNGQFYVPFTIQNTGGDTAETVQVVAELRIGDTVESGEQLIDFLAGDETEEGAFVFTRNPQEGELVLRVASYKMP
jgi:uncharacterized protein (TIGR02588 family)